MSLRLDYLRLTRRKSPPERAFFSLDDVGDTLSIIDRVRELHEPYDRLIYTTNGPDTEATCLICQTPFPCQTRQIVK